ncbi:4518_t:CDS:10 [Entrophospora sp. SA101]|nr:11845_t:CDS:10 [Entrophospora sp. SA101]CAJ0855739.1 4518_t:CDS:10 [Entrophospora sp. SA101]
MSPAIASSSTTNNTIDTANQIEENTNIVKSMKETSVIIAFCEKFGSLLKGIEFWPEELEYALAQEAQSELVEKIHCAFLTNCLNRKRLIEGNAWKKILSETIDKKIKMNNQFYQNYNPLRQVNDYYELDVEDKSNVIREAIFQIGRKVRNNDIDVLPFGEDKKGRGYYYFGKGARIYRETTIINKSKNQKKIIWEPITTTLEELENYINNSNELKASAGKDKQLRNKINNELIPKIKQDIEAKEKLNAKRIRKEKNAQRLADTLANIEIISSRTRSGARRAAGLDNNTSSTRNDDNYVTSSSHYMTRSKRVCENDKIVTKRRYEEIADEEDKNDGFEEEVVEEDSNTNYVDDNYILNNNTTSTTSRRRKIDVSNNTDNNINNSVNAVSVVISPVDTSEIMTEPMSRSISTSSTASTTSNGSKETTGTESSVPESVSSRYKEIFGSESEVEPSEPDEYVVSEPGSNDDDDEDEDTESGDSRKNNILPPPDIDYATPPKDSLIEDLRFALEHAGDLYADVAWEFTFTLDQTIIFAHKAILYARSSRSFQERFLKNRDSNGMSIKSVRLSNLDSLIDAIIVKTDADPILFQQELNFFYTGEEGSEEFLAAVDTTDELEQDKLKEDLIYMYKSKLYTDIEIILEYPPQDNLEIISEEDEELDLVRSVTFKAHKFMLAARSEYFREILSSSNPMDPKAATIYLDTSIFSQTAFNMILEYIYTGNLQYSLTLETCEWIWVGSYYLGIKNLCEDCIHRIATRLHYFTCTCSECQIAMPSVAAFAKEYDVKKLWQGCLHVLTKGFDIMWPHKNFAELDGIVREEILLALVTNIQNSDIMSIFKGCRKIISTINVKNITDSPWIGVVRKMTKQVKSSAIKVLVENFEQVCNEGHEFLDCVDGVGYSHGFLEDIMSGVVHEGLNEQNSAKVLKSISSKLLTRPAVINAKSIETKRILVESKQYVFEYMKRHCLNIRQNGGFKLLNSWLLEEFSHSLGVSTQELLTVANPSQTHHNLKNRISPRPSLSSLRSISSKETTILTEDPSETSKDSNPITEPFAEPFTEFSPIVITKESINGPSIRSSKSTSNLKVPNGSVVSPSVSPSRYGGVRQTRSSILRQMKYDNTDQKRGRDRERSGISPNSSRANSIVSVSSVTSNATTTSSHHQRRKRSPSRNSQAASIVSPFSGNLVTSIQPKPFQIKFATSLNPDISIGRRVIIPTKGNASGTIQFLGETEFAKGIWVGVELDDSDGKNNGTVANIKYFAAANNHDIFNFLI